MKTGRRTTIGLVVLALSGGAIFAASTASAASTTSTTTPLTAHAADATASSGVLSGRCTASRGNYATFRLYYYTKGKNDVFNNFHFQLAGPGLGNRNNVTLAVTDHNRGAFHSWVSKDNVHRGHGGIKLNWPVPRKERVFAEATFVFDRLGYDPSCRAYSKGL